MTSAWMAERKTLLACLALLFWISLCASAYWYYQQRWQQAYPGTDGYALFNGQALGHWLAQFHQAGRITLVHLGRPECFCNRFTDPHRQQIQAHYQPLGVAFVAPALPDELQVATPAAALMDANGRLAYLGAYSDSLLCSVGDGQVEPLLDQLLAGQQPDLLHTTGVGCFCPPPTR